MATGMARVSLAIREMLPVSIQESESRSIRACLNCLRLDLLHEESLDFAAKTRDHAMNADAQPLDVFQNLRRLRRARPASREQCGLCGAPLGERHRHLLDLKTRNVVCGCEPCSILFSDAAAGGYQRIPEDIQALPDFAITDVQWEELSIPINMAFFCRSAAEGEASVFYPSPAGATQAHLELLSWRNIVEQNPALQKMQPEVQALLVNRITRPYEYYVVPIDECYRLVGLIRTTWRGFSGGKEAWRGVAEFFASLRERAEPARGVRHA